jgi:cytochrome bd-type quinol oxidase subunit 2
MIEWYETAASRMKAWFAVHPRAHSIVLTSYYLAIIGALILLYGRGDFSTPAFVYQGF